MTDVGKPIREVEAPAPVRLPSEPEREEESPVPEPAREPEKVPA